MFVEQLSEKDVQTLIKKVLGKKEYRVYKTAILLRFLYIPDILLDFNRNMLFLLFIWWDDTLTKTDYWNVKFKYYFILKPLLSFGLILLYT